MTIADERVADVEEERDLSFALWWEGLSGDKIANLCCELVIKHLRRNPRFANLTLVELEDFLYDAVREIENEVDRRIARATEEQP